MVLIWKIKTVSWSFLLLFLLLIGTKVNYGQVNEDTGQILIEISNIISSIPGHYGDDYMDPEESDLNSWENMMNEIFMGNYSNAGLIASVVGYDIVHFTDTSEILHKSYYVIKNNGSNYWGTYVYNPNYCRPLVIQVPHSKKEFNTGKEGIHVFKRTEAMFYCLSGTSRCNQSSYSNCDGKTSICSDSSENYRISDMSHSVASIFQKTTDILLNKFTNTYFVQLHGFSKLASDPYVILSNGTTETPDLDYLPILKSNLLIEDTSLSCKIAHIDLEWTRLRGFTITQGRLINSSPDPCFAYATSTNGRFINIEQEKTKLRNDITGWDKMANALSNTFVCYPFVWNGSLDTDWNNAANWREIAVPNSSENVTIANGIYDPVINNPPESPVICNNLEIQSAAALHINPGKALTVSGTLANFGSVNINSNGEGTGSLIHSNGNVNATVECYLTENKWHYISAPVDNPKAEVFLGMYMIRWDEPTGQWNEITNPNYLMSTDMEGFAIWNWDISTLTFSGNLNTGVKSFNTSNSFGALHDNKGFNFCGNPYPSSLNWNVDEGNGWIRTEGNTDLSLYIWNQEAGNYGVYLKDNPTGTNSVDSIIPPHQGFFIHCSAETGYIRVDNGARLHFSKDILKKAVDFDGPMLKLRVEGNNYADEILLSINPLSSAHNDKVYDALKLGGDEEAPQLYSLSKDSESLSINAFPETEEYNIIPIGLEVGKADIYVLSVNEIYGFDHGNNIYLEDIKSGIYTKVESNSSYSFLADPKDNPVRFMLHLNGKINASECSDKLINIFTINKAIYVETPVNTAGNIFIYNIIGQRIASAPLTTSITEISVAGGEFYTVRVISNIGMQTKKIFVR
ncbi:MAG: hypothetical protein K9H49_08180 [Bacteroidales bacterium]|nr:hypothetical protein [Bacteroidales bacterium]MCF8404686.1 hypothetical protein [Bacteroidales bacterium]